MNRRGFFGKLGGLLAAGVAAPLVKPIVIAPEPIRALSADAVSEMVRGLKVAYNPPEYITLEWDAVPGATSYVLSHTNAGLHGEFERRPLTYTVEPVFDRCQG